MLALARVLRIAALLICGTIALAIVLRLLNVGVAPVHDAGAWLAGPFKGLFSLDGARASMALNWGLAALVYAIVAGLLHRLLAGADGHGRFGRPTIAP